MHQCNTVHISGYFHDGLIFCLLSETFKIHTLVHILYKNMKIQKWLSFVYCISQGLAAFLKAIGYLIPLMDAEYANYYTREVMLILKREFQSPDEEMKKIVLKVRERGKESSAIISSREFWAMLHCISKKLTTLKKQSWNVFFVDIRITMLFILEALRFIRP